MTTEDTDEIKTGDTVKVVDAQHYAAGNLGVVKSIVKDVHTVEVELANGAKAVLKFVQKQLGWAEDEVQQGLDVLAPGENGTEESKPSGVGNIGPPNPLAAGKAD